METSHVGPVLLLCVSIGLLVLFFRPVQQTSLPSAVSLLPCKCSKTREKHMISTGMTSTVKAPRNKVFVPPAGRRTIWFTIYPAQITFFDMSQSEISVHSGENNFSFTHSRSADSYLRMLEGFIFYKRSINGKVNVALNKTKLLSCNAALSLWAYCIIFLHQQVTIKFEFAGSFAASFTIQSCSIIFCFNANVERQSGGTINIWTRARISSQ